MIEVKLAWWLRYLYLPLLMYTVLFYQTYIDSEAEPNWDKFDKIMCKGLSAKVIK